MAPKTIPVIAEYQEIPVIFAERANGTSNRLSKNYYHILEVSPSATGPEIKAAYKRLALRFHPDKNPGSQHAEERFKQINEAYQILSNPRRRAAFDQQQQYERHQRQAAAHANPRYHHTRQPAGFKERHYQQRPPRQSRFSKRDIRIIASVVMVVLLLLLGLKLGWDKISAGRALNQAEQAAAKGAWAEADKAYSEYLEYQPDAQQARIQRASIRSRHLKDPQGAVLDYGYLLNSSPNANWYLERGNCQLALKQFQPALQDFDQALKLDSSLTEAYQGRAVAHLQLEDDWMAAIGDLTYFLTHAPIQSGNVTEAYLYRAYALYRTQQYDLAWQDTETALASDAYNAKGYYLQAVISRAQKGTAISCELLAKAAQLGFAVAEEEKERYCK